MATGGDSGDFRRALFGGLLEDLYTLQPRRRDPERFALGRGARARGRALDAAAVAAARLGLARRPRSLEAMTTSLVRLVDTTPELERVYRLFDDESSRTLFVELLRFRALGPRRVRLRRNSRAYWEAHASVDRRFLRERRTRTACGWPLSLYEIPGRTGPIRLHAHHMNVLNTFVLDQYAYGDLVRAGEGDVVVDGGACWGDTTLAFADRVGPGGRVHGFEFEPDNLAILRENLELNPQLASRVTVHEKALWSRAGDRVAYTGRGPSTSVAAVGAGAGAATTTTVDELDAPVAFVKLDVEGAELAALDGAAATIAAAKPKLAVATYHSDDDFMRIPARVKALEPTYRLFLEHLTAHGEETILFAVSGLGEGVLADRE